MLTFLPALRDEHTSGAAGEAGRQTRGVGAGTVTVDKVVVVKASREDQWFALLRAVAVVTVPGLSRRATSAKDCTVIHASYQGFLIF